MAEAEEEENPFRLPPDDEIFLMREQERRKRAEERELSKDLKVHQKTTAASRIHRIQRFVDDAKEEKKEDKSANVFLGAGAATIGRDARREKENIADFVAKKREMFLVQMSLDVKKAEILKLDEKARMREEALRKSQQMLGEDVDRFDRFLQANDAKAHRAMKQAEDMTKEKQQRLQKIKNLKSQISAIQSDISKHKEQKEECIKYKQFLDKLTPTEWKERQMEMKRERRRQRKEDYVQARLDEISAQMQAEIEAEEREVDRDIEEREKKRKVRKKKQQEEDDQREREREMELRKRRIRKKYPTRETLEKEYGDDADSGEELPLYFQHPKQLLDIFTQLEEQNLFLIQNSQETEQQLEEIEQKLQEAKQSQEQRATQLKENIRDSERKIEEETLQAEALRQRILRKSGTNGTTDLLKELHRMTTEVFRTCGFDSDHDPGNLQMLASIEQRLEELLSQLEEAENLYPELVKRLETNKEKERREKVRQERARAQHKKNEERLRASLLRSQAPVHKKTGKQIMFRSAPLHQEKKVVAETDDDAEAEQTAKLFGIYVGRDGNPHATKPDKDGS